MDSVQNQQHDEFVTSQWVELGSLHQQHGGPSMDQQPNHDFGGYGYGDATMPSNLSHPGSPFRLQPAPAPIGPNYLGVPAQWNSMIATPTSNPTSYIPAPANAGPPPPSQSITTPSTNPPLTTNLPALATSTHAATPSPRRTLTDADRRRMCLYHEEHPNVKQTEIGAMFGVERSTVSKVLRQKEKYLYPDDGSRSPIKRSKGKFPDIERALAVWAKNAKKQGVAITDKMIYEKARLFATSIGMTESNFKANSAGWLEKFKQKNNITVKHDPADGSGEAAMSRSRSQSSVAVLGSPMTVTRSQDSHYTQTDSPESWLEWGGGNYKHAASPTSPFFSPDQTTDSGRPSPLFPSQQVRLGVQHRPRSQTYPLIALDPTYISSPPSSEPLTPKMAGRAPISLPIESPAPDGMVPPLASPHDSPPMSHNGVGPSKDDARRALEVVMSYLRQQPVGIILEPDEYLCIGKLLGRFGMEDPMIPSADGSIIQPANSIMSLPS